MSAENDGLYFPTAVDLSGLDRDFATAEDMVDRFATSVGSRLESLPVARLRVEADSTAGPDPSNNVAQLATSVLPLATKIRESITSAMAPIAQFAERFGAQFERVAPEIEKLAIRIDEAMRFPEFLKRVDAFRRGFLSRFQEMGQEAPKALNQGLGQVADASQLVAPFTAARQQVKKAVAPIPGDVGYALDQATHVDAKAAFPGFMAGLDELRGSMKSVVMDANVMATGVAQGVGKGAASVAAQKRAAADLAKSQAAVPPRDNTTKATQAQTSAWERLGHAIIAAGEVEEATGRKLAQLVARDARDIDRLVGAWVGLKKVVNTFSSFGSIAGATFGKLAGLKMPKFTIDSRQSTVLKGIGDAAVGATGKVKSLAGSLASTLAVSAGLFSASYVAVDFFKGGIQGASDLNESLNKTDVILGTASPKVKAFADEMASKFGTVKNVTLDTAASLGGLGKSLGNLRGEKLADFSKQFTSLAADVSSIQNIDMKSAADALRVGLSGEQSDVLKQLGVVTTEVALKQYGLAHGFIKAGESLNEQQKFYARAGIITQKLAFANGDLAKTIDSPANAYRRLTGTVTNLATTVGTALMPAVGVALDILNRLASFATSSFGGVQSAIGAAADWIIDKLDIVEITLTNWPNAFEVARLVIYQGLVNIGEYFAALGPNIGIIAEYIANNWTKLLSDAFNATITGLKNLWSNWQAVGTAIGEWFADPTQGFHVDWTPLLDGFKATAEKFPELLKPTLTDMSAQIAEAAKPITEGIEARRAKRAADKVAGPAAAQLVDAPIDEVAPADAKKGKKEKTFAGALELGSKEAYSSVANALGGRAGKGNGVEDATKNNGRKIDDTNKLLAKMVGGGNAKPKVVRF